MNGNARAAGSTPAAEAVGTIALFLNVAALIAFAICLGSFAVQQPILAAAAGVGAVVAFAISMVCFMVDSRQFEEARATS